MLRIREEGMAGELKRIPERKIPSPDALDAEESRGDAIRSKVSFSEEVPRLEEVVEEEEGRKEKGQNSKEISRSDPPEFVFYIVYHRNRYIFILSKNQIPRQNITTW